MFAFVGQDVIKTMEEIFLFILFIYPNLSDNVKVKNAHNFTCAVHAAHWVKRQYI
jgi:hypothetical protein